MDENFKNSGIQQNREVDFLDKTPFKDRLAPKTIKGIFVAYSKVLRGYRIWVLTKSRIVVSSDVVFYDEFENINEDFISNETINGRSKLFEDTDGIDSNRKARQA